MMNIVFVHPYLCIGGAEQLVVTAANCLRAKEGVSDVAVATAHHEKKNSFTSTVDGTINVEVYGAWLPHTVAGRFTAFCSLICTFYVVVALLLQAVFLRRRFDVIVVDQVAAVIPLCKLFARKVAFYCHFPDCMLCTNERGRFRQAYRKVINSLEGSTISRADAVMVNSKYTESIFRAAFPHLSSLPVKLLYPPVDIAKLTELAEADSASWTSSEAERLRGLKGQTYFLSLNRFERKKRLEVALEAFSLFLAKAGLGNTAQVTLVVAGGYSDRVAENVEYALELEHLARSLSLGERVIFLKSASDAAKAWLLRNARALLYTAQNEHFGIGPCESMALGTPVIACNSGGLRETVRHGHTGYLCDNGDKNEFSDSMVLLYRSGSDDAAISVACQERVRNLFHTEVFCRKLAKILL